MKRHKKENPVTVASLATGTVTGFTRHNRCKTRLAFIVGYLVPYRNEDAALKGHYLYNLYYTTKGRTKLCSKVGLSP